MYRIDNSMHSWTAYNLSRQKYKEKIQETIRKHNVNEMRNSNNKQKATWSVINREKSSHINDEKHMTGTGSSLSADPLNHFLAPLGRKLLIV